MEALSVLRGLFIFCLSFALIACGPARPRTFTAAPAVQGSARGVIEAKDFLSRARRDNKDIDATLSDWERRIGK